MNESVQGETRELFSVVYFATGLKKARAEGKKCHAKTMKNKKSWENS